MNTDKDTINCSGCGLPIISDKKSILELCPECGFLNKKLTKPSQENQSFL